MQGFSGELTQKRCGLLKTIPVFNSRFRSLRLKTDIPLDAKMGCIEAGGLTNSVYNLSEAMYICLMNEVPNFQAEAITLSLAMEGGGKCRQSEGQEPSSASDPSQCRSCCFFIPSFACALSTNHHQRFSAMAENEGNG